MPASAAKIMKPGGESAGRIQKPRARPKKVALPLGSQGQVIELSVPIQNLLNDEFIVNAPRIDVDGRKVPALGGIPLFSKLGQGGMGAVYYGIHRGLVREVAVKVLPFHLAQLKPHLVKRFFREARIAAKINSEHLVHVTDVDQEATLSYLVMEYVSGVTAASFLKDARLGGAEGLDEAVALDICIATCKGLAAAHEANVIHRDVKPDNILIPITADNSDFDCNACKLADLGLASMEESGHSMTNADSCLGTPGFMAPEMIVDARKGGKPADVFGLGATLYNLLCGEAPFSGPTHVLTMWKTIDSEHVPIRTRRPQISKPTAEMIDICLAKEAANRYADGLALLKALQTCRTSLNDPQSVNYAEVNKPRIDREKIEIHATESVVESHAPDFTKFRSARHARAAQKMGWIVAAVLALAGSASIYAWATFTVKPTKPQADNLPSASKLDDAERAADASYSEDEAKRKNAMAEYTQKLERTRAAAAKQREAKP